MAMGDPYPIVTDAFLLQENGRLEADLAAERERTTKLREALEPFAKISPRLSPQWVDEIRRARAVLKETEK
jgi:hypothetical protein